MLHPARTISYCDLVKGLREAKEKKLVSEQADGDLRLYCYSKTCVYNQAWNEITLLARGLVLDVVRKRVIATPFPKFFNLGERDGLIPDLSFDVLEKLDGSLIIIFCHRGIWRCATKGSFHSEQAQAASLWLRVRSSAEFREGVTYLAEYIGPKNRIVVPYKYNELVLLSAYDEDGGEWEYSRLQDLGNRLFWKVTSRKSFTSISDLVERAAGLPLTEEGFVLRFSDGSRLKVKGDEYRRVHALISRCTPLALWEAMQAGDNLMEIRQQLPEEFWSDFDGITYCLNERIQELILAVKEVADSIASWTDKEVGLVLSQWSDPIRSFIFPYRKGGGDLMNGRSRQALFRVVRPTANRLDGYISSYAIDRVLKDE